MELEEGDMSKVAQYLQLLEVLRAARRAPTWKPEQDRPWLAQLEDLYDAMSADDQQLVAAQSWRGWPDKYDERIVYREITLDAAEDGPIATLPRCPEAA
jgi:hypothetical protein